MATIDEIRKNRLKKLKAIENAGLLTYPGQTKRTHSCFQALEEFSKLSRAKKEIILVGRIMSLRQHGGIVFCHIKDGSERIQICFKKDRLGEKSFQFFLDNFDIGDLKEFYLRQRGERKLLKQLIIKF